MNPPRRNSFAAGVLLIFGLLCGCFETPPLAWIFVALIMGTGAAASSQFFLRKTRMWEAILSDVISIGAFGLLATNIGAAKVLGSIDSTLAAVSLGSFWTASFLGIPHVMEWCALRFFKSRTVRENFLRALPPPLQNELRSTLTKVVFANARETPGSVSEDSSSLGGNPSLPPHHNWPTTTKRTALRFLAQINLKEVPQTSVKRSSRGCLLFFLACDAETYDETFGENQKDVGTASVVYLPESSSREERTNPDRGPVHPSQGLVFQTFPLLAHSAAQMDRYYAHLHSLGHWECQSLSIPHSRYSQSRPAGHRVLSPRERNGYGGPDEELEIAAQKLSLPPETPWSLLLELESSEAQGWCWGDTGAIAFWAPAEDVASGRFDRVWVTLDSP